MTMTIEAELDLRYDAPPPWPKRIMPLQPLLSRFANDTGALAKCAGVSRRTVQRWSNSGLTYSQADWVCCRVREYPAHVWLDWHDDDPEEDLPG